MIVRQPNGLFAVWSGKSNDFTLENMSIEKIIETWGFHPDTTIARNTVRIAQSLEKGIKPYGQYTLTYEECIALKNQAQEAVDKSSILDPEDIT